MHSLDQLLGRGRGVSGKTRASPLCGRETLSAELGWEGWEENIGPEQAEKGGRVLDEARAWVNAERHNSVNKRLMNPSQAVSATLPSCPSGSPLHSLGITPRPGMEWNMVSIYCSKV